MENIYYIEKEATYSHGIFGIFSNLDKAKEKAKECANRDEDNHHIWNVKLFTIQEKVSVDKNDKILFSYQNRNPA